MGETSLKQRILTIEVVITDKEKALWIWDNHMGKDTGNGVYVQKILEGEIPENYIEEDYAKD